MSPKVTAVSIRFPETSVSNYQPWLGNIPEGQRPPEHRGGSLQSPIFIFMCRTERQKILNWAEASTTAALRARK
jgi:hypothetical protein